MIIEVLNRSSFGAKPMDTFAFEDLLRKQVRVSVCGQMPRYWWMLVRYWFTGLSFKDWEQKTQLWVKHFSNVHIVWDSISWHLNVNIELKSFFIDVFLFHVFISILNLMWKQGLYHLLLWLLQNYFPYFNNDNTLEKSLSLFQHTMIMSGPSLTL